MPKMPKIEDEYLFIFKDWCFTQKHTGKNCGKNSTLNLEPLNLEPLNGYGQTLTASALAQSLPSCRQERGGRIGR